MTNLPAEEFASWLRPRDAVRRLGAATDAASQKEIAARIGRGDIGIAGRRFSDTGGEPEPSLIDLDYLLGPWDRDWGMLWSSGQASFVRGPIASGGFATLSIVGLPVLLGRPEIHIFREVRLNPVDMAREFDLDLLTGTVAPQPKGLPLARKGGRPAGKHGEPIARVTRRLSVKSDEELRGYTAEALGVELIEEYRTLGLDPPSEANACRDAAGILKVVRG